MLYAKTKQEKEKKKINKRKKNEKRPLVCTENKN